VLEAVRKDGRAFEYASDDLKKDLELRLFTEPNESEDDEDIPF